MACEAPTLDLVILTANNCNICSTHIGLWFPTSSRTTIHPNQPRWCSEKAQTLMCRFQCAATTPFKNPIKYFAKMNPHHVIGLRWIKLDKGVACSHKVLKYCLAMQWGTHAPTPLFCQCAAAAPCEQHVPRCTLYTFKWWQAAWYKGDSHTTRVHICSNPKEELTSKWKIHENAWKNPEKMPPGICTKTLPHFKNPL